MKALPALAIGDFRERPAAAALGHSFASVWVHRLPEAAAPIVVTPDGTIDLQWMDGSFRVAGPDRDPKLELLPAGTTVIGFRFHPGAAAAWLGMPAAEIVGHRLALDELWGAKARRLAAGIRPDRDAAGLIGELEAAIAARAPARGAPDPVMRAAFELVRSGPPPGAPLVPWLGRALAMSERTLRRRFDESFGYGPKTLDRIMRYQRFLELSRRSAQPTARLALEAGYADQAHLVRESRRLAGVTPHEFGRILNHG